MCINVGGGIHCAPKKLFLELIFFFRALAALLCSLAYS